jgi:hypothetical protein
MAIKGDISDAAFQLFLGRSLRLGARPLWPHVGAGHPRARQGPMAVLPEFQRRMGAYSFLHQQ